MKNSIKKVVGILALTVLVSANASAQENDREKPKKRPTIKQLFKDLDTNEDGKISLKEVKGPLKRDFKKIDTNEDGFLSKKEIEKAPKPKRKERPKN